jgi:dienelactone hydrolase
MPAQQLAQTRAGARGALLLHSCVPVSEFGTAWPAGVPVQVHGMDADPFFTEDDGDLDAARALVASTEEAELSCIPARSTCSPIPRCRRTTRAAATLLQRRVLEFLDRIH